MRRALVVLTVLTMVSVVTEPALAGGRAHYVPPPGRSYYGNVDRHEVGPYVYVFPQTKEFVRPDVYYRGNDTLYQSAPPRPQYYPYAAPRYYPYRQQVQPQARSFRHYRPR